MLEHGTGMMGFPLRLLAREVYDRVARSCGAEAVALITGEERRVPAAPRYWVCTVEAMPRHPVDFLAVDEVQLAAHVERGHVFTERLLHWRGRQETWFLGADTIRPVLERLVPHARVERRARLSRLDGRGQLPLGQLPPRTAVVAFSAARVYELAERLKLKRGGAAVVLGALSPRTRNAQVAMYQAGEVDFLVATDAIGMGLNMNVDCVAFADLKKFDGRQSRALEPAELAQIAGRAGRNRNDGQFCTLAPLSPLPLSTTRAIEQHDFPPLERLFWRTEALDFSSAEALLRGLGTRPFDPCLQLADHAEDQQALERLVRRGDVQALARGAERVELLWQVCQIPDFRKLLLDDHFELLASIYVQLCQRHRLDTTWVQRQVERLDDVSGELDMLLVRMAAVRTWTFITHRTTWLDDALGWQERTLAIEDRLSEALHEQLVSRFVDVRSRRRSPRAAGPAPAAQPLLRTDGPRTARSFAELATFQASPEAPNKVALREASAWDAAPDERFALTDTGHILDRAQPGADLARLGIGPELQRPEIVLLGTPAAHAAHALKRRLSAWLKTHLGTHLPHLEPEAASSPALRAVLYGLRRSLGSVPADVVEAPWDELADIEKQDLAARGIVYTPAAVFVVHAMTPLALATRWALLAPHWPWPRPPRPSPERRVVPARSAGGPALLWQAAGYVWLEGTFVRADWLAASWARTDPDTPDTKLARWLHCRPAVARRIKARWLHARAP
ncbi:MAG: helicase [Myxococcales bacterium]|nr:helicase [Myxococcales bacterium]